MKISIGTAVGAIFALLNLIDPSKGDVLGWLAESTISDATKRLNEMAQQRIDQLLKGFDATSHSLLDQGAHDGNLLLLQGGNEMQLIVASARAQFGSEMDRQVSHASAELRPFLVELERFTLSIGEFKNNAVDFEDLLALDLGDLPFSNSYFGIRRIIGSVMVQNGADNYRIVLRGPHFGTASSGEKIHYDVTLDGVPLKEPELGIAPNDAVFHVPAESLKGKFQKTALVTLPLDVTITRDIPKIMLVFGGAHDVIKHQFIVSLMPDYAGELQVVTTRPVFSWKVILAPETQDKTVTKPETFSFTVANPAVLGSPSSGEQKIADTIISKCHEDMRPARKFPNNRVEFSDNPVFVNGWDTPKYIGADPIDWDIATRQVFDTWGIRWSTWGHNACGPINSGRHCHVPAQVLLDNSTESTKDATGCHQTSLAPPQWRNNHTSVSVDVLGGTPNAPAPWSLTFQALSFIQTGSQDAPVQTYPLFASKFTSIDVLNPNGAPSTITFAPSVGKPKQGILGNDLPKGPRLQSQALIGTDILRLWYSFQYPATQ